MFKISPDLPIEITHNVSSTNTFASQDLIVKYKTQHLSNHINIASLTCLGGESPIKDSKLQLISITQLATYNYDQ